MIGINKKPCAGLAVVYRPDSIVIIFYHDDGRKARQFTRPYYRHWLDKLVTVITFGQGKEYSRQVYVWGWAAWRPGFVEGINDDFQLAEAELGWIGLWLIARGWESRAIYWSGK